MDIQKFVEQFQKNGSFPPAGELDDTPNVQCQPGYFAIPRATIQVLRLATNCLQQNEVYCEVTNQPNLTLLEILVDQPQVMAYSIVDLDPVDNTNTTETFWQQALDTEITERLLLCQQSALEFFQDLTALDPDEKIGILFLDARQDYRSQLLTLLAARPFLADQALIILNQSHWSSIQQANLDFAQIQPQCRLWFDGTSEADLPYWNGLQLYLWSVTPFFDDVTTELPENNLSLINKLQDIQTQERYSLAKAGIDRMQVLIEEGQIRNAQQNCELYLSWTPKNAALWLDNVSMLLKLGHIPSAIETATYTRELAIQQKAGIILRELALLLRELALLLREKKYMREAELTFQALIDLNPDDFEPYCELGFLHLYMYNFDQAIQLYRKALALNPDCEEAYYRYIYCLIETGSLDEAYREGKLAIEQFPDSFRIKFKIAFMLPVLYQKFEDIAKHRCQFSQNLTHLIQDSIYSDSDQLKNIINGAATTPSFYLAYQNHDDRNLQEKYGHFIHQLLAAKYPEWTVQRPMPEIKDNNKIRIGYLSNFLHYHTVSKLFYNWIAAIDKHKFEIFVYYSHSNEDQSIKNIKSNCDHFANISHVIDDVVPNIIDDDLHMLVYLDIGMDPFAGMIAALRLAPVQCLAWGHPVTSGLPTIDYFLSSELMEPENAQEHYTETLVRLPNLGIAYSVPDIPIVHQPRSEVLSALAESDIAYLSCQSQFKYLPQYDYIFPAIAQRVPDAKFVFLSHFSAHTTEIFKERLKNAFALEGLQYEDFCIVLPRQTPDAYLALNQISDIYLDTLAWSGGNTTLEAVACGLPIVTCPGQFMRGRHSYAILKMLDVPETIAQNEQDYIDIAVRLGLDPEWRNEIVEKMRQNQSKLYNDPVAIQGLEAFYQKVVHDRLSSTVSKTLEPMEP